ncbi:MAG: PSD1 and planctomycete cytochrome C domain-containing protein [Fuerstiella sp.]|nr:PSD1 and planctomycete cytochrome C domain-containing protein [Fuerstiella sp.]
MRQMAGCMCSVAILLVRASCLFGDTIDQSSIDFFEKKIRPVLVTHCYECHSIDAKDLKGGLRLDSRAGLRRGGDSGGAIVAGDPNASLLISSLRHDDLEMPPGGKLDAHIIDDFVKWIQLGAPDPRDNDEGISDTRIDIEAAREFWAFRSLSGVSGTIDEIAGKQRAAMSIPENPAADKYTLLRRIFFDLTGLPPEPRDVIAFVGDESPDAYEHVVDRLLASSRFGERWGRHWLDLAQYADSLDAERIFPNRGAWRYRDYVIRSMNQDKPFDRFLVEQIAGDLLPFESDAERAEQMIATQFITLGPVNLVNQFKIQLQMDIVDNQIDKIGRVFFGLSVGCARCHDHKFDPLEQEDYYRMAGILKNVQVLNGFRGVSGVFSDWLRQPIPELPEELADRVRRTELHRKRAVDMEAVLAAKRTEIARLQTESGLLAEEESSISQEETIEKLKGEIAKLERDIQNHVKANTPRPPAVLAAAEPTRPTNARVNIRGNALNLGKEIQRGIPRLLGSDSEIPKSASGRMELAKSLISVKNPIVVRVFVNRVWHHLFGRGIVRTVDNFGTRGEKPSHPELLDSLAEHFVAQGWHLKPLIREIVLSRTYQLSSSRSPSASSTDPDNRLLWRHSVRRLDAESIRDSYLMISGSLSPLAGGPTLPPAEWNTQEIGQFDQINNPKGGRPEILHGRSIYLPVSRAALRFEAGDPLRQFDFPSPNDIVGARQSSTVPTQALYLMNSPFVSGLAQKFAARILAEPFASDAEKINGIYLSVYGRPVQPGELKKSLGFLAAASVTAETDDSETSTKERYDAALARLCHAVLISTEFLIHD